MFSKYKNLSGIYFTVFHCHANSFGLSKLPCHLHTVSKHNSETNVYESEFPVDKLYTLPSAAIMVTEDPHVSQNPDELISSFQVLDLVAEALSQIQSGHDPAAVTPTIARIHQKFKECEIILDSLPGGAMTKQDQLVEIQRLRESLQRKRALVERYSRHDVISRVLTQDNAPQRQTSTVPGPAVEVDNEAEDDAQPDYQQESGADSHMIDDSFDVSGVQSLHDSLGKDATDEVLMDFELN